MSALSTGLQLQVFSFPWQGARAKTQTSVNPRQGCPEQPPARSPMKGKWGLPAVISDHACLGHVASLKKKQNPGMGSIQGSWDIHRDRMPDESLQSGPVQLHGSLSSTQTVSHKYLWIAVTSKRRWRHWDNSKGDRTSFCTSADKSSSTEGSWVTSLV